MHSVVTKLFLLLYIYTFNFIDSFLGGCVIFVAVWAGLFSFCFIFSSCSKQELPSSCGAQVSHCNKLSPVTEHRSRYAVLRVAASGLIAVAAGL